MDYNRKVELAIKLLQSIPQDGPIELSYSGGKDSDVILELAKMAGIPFEAIYKQTTIDPPGTTAHAKEVGATIVRPEKTFLQLVSENGLPTRFRRFCCEKMKEYKIHDRAIQGIRRSESTARAKRYKEPEICRTYPHKQKVRVYLPILEWTDADVERFIKERGIKLAPVYYDADGNFDVKKRLGCICCPMTSRKKLCEEYKKYPKFLKAEIKALAEYQRNKPGRKSTMRFKTPYNQMFYHIFCDNLDQYETRVNGGLLPDSGIDTKKFLEDYFKIDLTY